MAMMGKNDKRFRSLGEILSRYDFQKDKYISREFQKYGYDLAVALGDLENRSLYIKLAKKEPRAVLEKIKFAALESKATNKKKLFLWKLGQYHWQEKLVKKRLKRNFFEKSPEKAAKALLGQILVAVDEKGILRAGEITETEAYFGPTDLASHARFGQKGRAKTMWALPGTAYVYLIYGLYAMFNVVAHQEKEAGAVLIRALKPLVGGQGAIACGPAKLTTWLKINLDENGEDLTRSSRLWMARGEKIQRKRVASGPRVGVEYAGEWAEKKLRFWIKRSRYVTNR